MGKISIVGVEGSGKTTLMAAFGEKYEVADEAGYFVTADNQQTFDKVKMLVARMRRGEWPGATEKGSVSDLGWTLWRRCKGENKLVSSLTFLDYGGEIYRLAFGTHSEEERKPFMTQIRALRHHIETSDAILLLINLKDVISGDLTSEKTREMLWVSRSIFDLARAGKRKPHLALAFSQTDLYRETLESTGGTEGAYRKYLPFIQSPYPDMRLLTLAAVDRTTVDPKGREIPAADFRSQGFDDFLTWLSSIAHEHARKRNIRLSLMAAALVILMIAGGVGAVLLAQRNREIREREIESMKIEQSRQQAESEQKRRQAEFQKQRAAEKREIERKRQLGYTITTENGKEIAQWLSGVPVPGHSTLMTSSDVETYRSKRPGYRWIPGTLDEEWSSGLVHPDNTDLVSDTGVGKWICTKDGYVWTGGVNCEWRAGLQSKQYPHWITYKDKGYYIPAPGYRKKDSSDKNSFEVVWTPGERDGARKAADEPDEWLYKCSKCEGEGYRDISSVCTDCRGNGNRGFGNKICKNCTRGRVDCDAEGSQWFNFFGQNVHMRPCPNHVVQWGVCVTPGCMNGHVLCPACFGMGKICPSCNGNFNQFGVLECENCKGVGKVTSRARCDACNGEGWCKL